MTGTVLITGASTGIGQATAEWFFQRGWNVAATMRRPQATRVDPRWLVVPLDVTDPASITAAYAAVEARWGRIDVLVNNAGYGLVGTFESMDEPQLRRQFETNVFGLMRCARAILPHFRAHGGGVLVNVGSMGGRLAFPFYSVYHATKWAVDGFSESLQFELRPLNIRVKIIEPGAIRTDFYERSMDFVHDPSLQPYEGMVRKGMARMTAAGRKGAPAARVAATIWRAATDQSWRLRYPVGVDARTLLALRRFLPDRWYQALVRGQLLR